MISASISTTASAQKYFYTASAETDDHDGQLLADFCLSPPAAMASSQPIMVTKRAGQTRCKSVVKSNATAWSSAMQMSGQYGCNKVVKSVQLRTYMP